LPVVDRAERQVVPQAADNTLECKKVVYNHSNVKLIY
jgi:hypothetical protein